MTEVYAVKLLEDNVFTSIKDDLIALLPPACKQPILRYKRIGGAQRTLLGDLLSRKIISTKIGVPVNQIEFKNGDKGKPFIENQTVYFNISHSGDWVVLAVSTEEVGIDVEKIRKVNFGIAERFYSDAEFAFLESQRNEAKIRSFFDIWTLKESYLKLLGTGLTKSLTSFSLSINPDSIKLYDNELKLEKPVFFKQYEIDSNYRLSVCSFMNGFTNTVDILSVADLTI